MGSIERNIKAFYVITNTWLNFNNLSTFSNYDIIYHSKTSAIEWTHYICLSVACFFLDDGYFKVHYYKWLITYFFPFIIQAYMY